VPGNPKNYGDKVKAHEKTTAHRIAFRGHRESVGDDSYHGGNFLALVAMQSRFDPVLQDLLRMPA